jgi:cysteinyl-tRNA synthetase
MRAFDVAAVQDGGTVSPALAPMERAFHDAMSDDLNTPQALAALDQIAGVAAHDVRQAGAVRTLLATLGAILGLFQRAGTREVPAEVHELVQRREQARKHKDFAAADRLRQDVAAKGFVIEDAPSGPVVLPKR